MLTEFDNNTQIKAAREAQGKYDDHSHQVEQKQAENKSNVEKRRSELEGAEADLKKAEIELRQGPILSEIEQRIIRSSYQDKAYDSLVNQMQTLFDMPGRNSICFGDFCRTRENSRSAKEKGVFEIDR